jgi:hypothetical protein
LTIQAIPYILLLGFLFGSTLIASRFSVGQYQPSTYIGLRMVLAGMGLIVIGISLINRQKHLFSRAKIAKPASEAK